MISRISILVCGFSHSWLYMHSPCTDLAGMATSSRQSCGIKFHCCQFSGVSFLGMLCTTTTYCIHKQKITAINIKDPALPHTRHFLALK